MSTPDTPSKQLKRSPGRPKRREAEYIEQMLLDVALAEFLEHGYGGASVSRIVRKAGISKTTLYSRFSSKEDIFRAIIEQQIERLSPADLLDIRGEPLDLEDGLRRYACHMINVSLEGDILGVNRLMYSESHRFPELGDAAAMRTQLGITRIAQFIKGCAERQGCTNLDARAVAEVFIFSMRGWYIDVMATNRKVTSAQRQAWVDSVIHVLLSAVDQQ